METKVQSAGLTPVWLLGIARRFALVLDTDFTACLRRHHNTNFHGRRR
jgi:hypothetical protein